MLQDDALHRATTSQANLMSGKIDRPFALAWPPLNAVLSQPASCPGERIQSVRLVSSLEGDHRKNLRAATSCGE